jgi:hypothetical protein
MEEHQGTCPTTRKHSAWNKGKLSDRNHHCVQSTSGQYASSSRLKAEYAIWPSSIWPSIASCAVVMSPL